MKESKNFPKVSPEEFAKARDTLYKKEEKPLTEEKAQECSHPDFYTIGDEVYCNGCHKHLGYFDTWRTHLFIKRTKNTIANEHLNKRIKHL